MGMFEGLIALLIFIMVGLFCFGILHYVNFKKMGEKVKQTPEIVSKAKGDMVKLVESIGNYVKPKSEEGSSGVRKMLVRAGYRRERAFIIFYGAKTFLAILLFGFSFLVRFGNVLPLYSVLICIIWTAVGFYLPNLWLKSAINRRARKLTEGLPDALDLMVVCVESGTGLDAAITRVSEEMSLSNKAITDEFKVMSLELRAGKQRRDALKNLAFRTGLEDITTLVTLLIQTDRFGTSIAQALRVHSDSMRTRRFQRAEEIAMKLPVKLVFPLVIFIFPSIFVVVLGPAVIRIVRVLLPRLAGI